MSLSGLLVLVPQKGGSERLLIGICIEVLALVLTVKFMPYATNTDNQLAMACRWYEPPLLLGSCHPPRLNVFC